MSPLALSEDNEVHRSGVLEYTGKDQPHWTTAGL